MIIHTKHQSCRPCGFWEYYFFRSLSPLSSCIIWTTLIEDIQMMFYTYMNALGLAVVDKKNFENCTFRTYFDPETYLCNNCNGINNFRRGPPWEHSCEVWSNANKRFQRWFSKIVEAWAGGCWTIGHHKSSSPQIQSWFLISNAAEIAKINTL